MLSEIIAAVLKSGPPTAAVDGAADVFCVTMLLTFRYDEVEEKGLTLGMMLPNGPTELVEFVPVEVENALMICS